MSNISLSFSRSHVQWNLILTGVHLCLISGGSQNWIPSQMNIFVLEIAITNSIIYFVRKYSTSINDPMSGLKVLGREKRFRASTTRPLTPLPPHVLSMFIKSPPPAPSPNVRVVRHPSYPIRMLGGYGPSDRHVGLTDRTRAETNQSTRFLLRFEKGSCRHSGTPPRDQNRLFKPDGEGNPSRPHSPHLPLLLRSRRPPWSVKR